MKTPTKTGTVALVIRYDGNQPVLVEALSDDTEIAILESALQSGDESPLETLHAQRAKQAKEDEEFGNYVEELLSQPFVRPEIQEHGLQWLRSKMRIETFERNEKEATAIISQYAFKMFQETPAREEFTLAGPKAKVNVKIMKLKSSQNSRSRVA